MNHTGSIIVKRMVFIKKIIPHIYRSILKDLVYYLIHYSKSQYNSIKRLNDEKNGHILQSLSLYSKWEELYHYNLTVPCNYNSPVMRAMVIYQERQTTGSNTKIRGSNTKVLHERIGDIEDLAKIVPPCLEKAMKKEWCMHYDRLNMTKYCYDLGYQNEEIATYFTRHQRDKQKNHFNSHYNECLRESPPDAVNTVSKSCSTIINYTFPNGNVIRCPFEEAAHGTKRVKSTPEEITNYQGSCACKGGFKDKFVNSPLDYIKHQLNKST